MNYLTVHLASGYGSKKPEGFQIVANKHISSNATEFSLAESEVNLKTEGSALADLLFDNVPGSTIDALIKQLRARYSELHNQDLLNPFKS